MVIVNCNGGAEIVASNLVQSYPGALILSSRCLMQHFFNLKPLAVVTLYNNFQASVTLSNSFLVIFMLDEKGLGLIGLISIKQNIHGKLGP